MKRFVFCILLPSLCFATSHAWGEDLQSMTTKAGGILKADEVWTAAGGPYLVTGTITVPSGKTLILEAGTTVYLDSSVNLVVASGGRLLADVDELTLKVRYDDGFVAYLNGQEVARGNFTGIPSWNSHADNSSIEASVSDFDAVVDISEYKDQLKAGTNVLAIHGMNASSTSSDFLISVAMDAVLVKVEGE